MAEVLAGDRQGVWLGVGLKCTTVVVFICWGCGCLAVMDVRAIFPGVCKPGSGTPPAWEAPSESGIKAALISVKTIFNLFVFLSASGAGLLL